MEILDPAGAAAVSSRPLAPRRASLDGVVIGLLDNSKPNAGTLLARVAALLVEGAGAHGMHVWRKPGSAMPARSEVLDEISALCAVVLTGSAD
jgi:hypothetical protein